MELIEIQSLKTRDMYFILFMLCYLTLSILIMVFPTPIIVGSIEGTIAESSLYLLVIFTFLSLNFNRVQIVCIIYNHIARRGDNINMNLLASKVHLNKFYLKQIITIGLKAGLITGQWMGSAGSSNEFISIPTKDFSSIYRHFGKSLVNMNTLQYIFILFWGIYSLYFFEIITWIFSGLVLLIFIQCILGFFWCIHIYRQNNVSIDQYLLEFITIYSETVKDIIKSPEIIYINILSAKTGLEMDYIQKKIGNCLNKGVIKGKWLNLSKTEFKLNTQ